MNDSPLLSVPHPTEAQPLAEKSHLTWALLALFMMSFTPHLGAAQTPQPPQNQQAQQAQQVQQVQQTQQIPQQIQVAPNSNVGSLKQYQQVKRGRSPQSPSRSMNVEGLPQVETKRYAQPQIQIAILLDVSGSMNGLINQARAELWKVVNTFNGVTQGGVAPEVRVALYSYGEGAAGEYGLYLKELVALTTDLDKISEVLFSLKTSGSNEFCSSTILAATRGQAWSEASSDLKAIIIAGNETFLQGPVTPMKAVKEAGARQIKTHTIHCGSLEDGLKDHWQEAAKMSGGQFMNINHNATEEVIPTPFDDQLEALNRQLNDTYIPYGAYGKRGQANQIAQDANAARLSKSSALSRGLTKSGSYYNNAQWDLVDAYKRNGLKVKELDVDQLPAAMRSLTPQARLEYVQKALKQRETIQKQIASLSVQRQAFIDKVRATKSEEGGERIDSAMIKALRDQATAIGFTWSPAQ